MFVKGQKVICVDNYSSEETLTEGRIYKIKDPCFKGGNGNPLLYKNDTGSPDWYGVSRFKTIIQSFGDVVVGMKLTHRVFGECIVRQIVYGEKLNVVYQALNGPSGSYGCGIGDFEEYKPKKKDRSMCNIKDTEYKVIRPFTILDLWNAFQNEHSCPEFQKEWGRLLEEMTDVADNTVHKFKDFKEEGSFNTIKDYPSLMDNLHHLINKGFIAEEVKINKKDLKLTCGETPFTYKVIDCGETKLGGGNLKEFMLLVQENSFIYEYGRKFTCETLKELNDITGEDFEVMVNE